MINELLQNRNRDNFYKLCIKKDGTQWTSLHRTMDKLMILGSKSHLLEIPLNIPREEWASTFDDGKRSNQKRRKYKSTTCISKEDYDKVTKDIEKILEFNL